MLTIVNNVACWLVSSRETPCKLYLPRYARFQIPTYKLCLIVIRSKYATHIHHVFKNCLLRCARFAIKNIRTCRSTQCWQLSIMLHVDLLVQVFKNCLLRCARFAIYYTLAHSMFHRLLKFTFFVLLYVFFSFLIK
jgi:hypothetical protein